MKALVYLGPGRKAVEDRPKPEITTAADAIIKITKTTICGTDLHILKGDVPIANIGVHGTKMDLHLESLWDRNITITTRLVDTVSTSMLLNTVQSDKIDPKLLITHRFELDRILDAYETFEHAADPKALKVIIEAGSST